LNFNFTRARSVIFSVLPMPLASLLLSAVTVHGLSFSGAYVRVAVTGPTCNVLDHGAVGDGITDDTAALQSTISACSGAGGGVTYFPRGKTFLSFGLTVPSSVGVALIIDGTLRFSNDTSSPRWPSPAKGCLYFAGGSDVALVGAGTVDGQGAAWWANRNLPSRPNMINIVGVTNFLIANLTFLNSPNHNLEVYASPAEVVGVTVLAPPSTGVDAPSHNTDAVDLHGEFFYIHGCHFSVGDDNLAIHSSHVLVERCTFGTGHGASIGSLGGAIALQNITVRNVSFAGTTAGVRIKVDTATTGFLRDVTFANLSMVDVAETVTVCFFYNGGGGDCNYPGKSAPTKGMTLQLSNVVVQGVTSHNAGAAGQFTCTSETPCPVTLKDVAHTGTAPKGWACSNARVAAVDVAPAPPASCGA
jgi:polygalacturonase